MAAAPSRAGFPWLGERHSCGTVAGWASLCLFWAFGRGGRSPLGAGVVSNRVAVAGVVGCLEPARGGGGSCSVSGDSWLRRVGFGDRRLSSVYVTLQAVFFDLDGTLINSEPDWLAVEEEIMAWLGGPWGPEYQDAVVGG